ncbi:MAG TPA: methylated-DNA--[protein]-cysteine S-methyltransferase [Clostridiales bacterium]|mgnify:CR=1 FL=1|nr:methylated-DNA--[protein]-cysteine S-methyltransferase [Clostridiales bacterium]
MNNNFNLAADSSIIYKAYYRSPIGVISILGNNKGIVAVDFIDEEESTCDLIIKVSNEEKIPQLPRCIQECIRQFDEYFAGRLRNFTVDIVINRGTDFQKKVWNTLREIPYGETSSYALVAEKIGNRKAVRAVGNANNRNPISIIIPCHRVIGSDGSLVGYGGGLWRKKWLLEHERTNHVLKQITY